ncbi:hypothetical protein PVK06_013080 [Gossypium arboreum]|uniref:Uncharacterized protein n=1 Tax=Gossypium arboreum TaxID=29729 RepID=A0ABR0QD86_GOSAR|nr:hypothetical protein PVK06_013080 [Gossypium arboreum]
MTAATQGKREGSFGSLLSAAANGRTPRDSTTFRSARGRRSAPKQCQRWRAVRRNGTRGGPADEERRLKILAARVAAVFFVMG